jgi:hypothetical protein
MDVSGELVWMWWRIAGQPWNPGSIPSREKHIYVIINEHQEQ